MANTNRSAAAGLTVIALELVLVRPLPLKLIVGVRSYRAFLTGATSDNCPAFTEPVLRAWQVPYVWLPRDATADDLAAAYRQARDENRAGAVLLPE